MYFARYDNGRSKVAQAAVSLPALVLETAGRQRWSELLRLAAEQTLAAPGVDFSVRFTVQNRRLDRLLLLTAGEDREDDLTALCAGFLRPASVVEESVVVPASRDQHDELLAGFPAVAAWIRNEPIEHRGCELVSDFRLAGSLDSLLLAALDRGETLAVQFNVCRHAADAEDLRAARKNLVRLEHERGLPPVLVESQRGIVERASGGFLVDEIVASADTSALRRVRDALDPAFAAGYARLGFRELPWDDETDLADLISTGFHASLFHDFCPLAKAAMTIDPGCALRLLAWRPPRLWPAACAANAAVEEDAQQGGLKKIEQRLDRVEKLLAERHAAAVECGELRKALAISRADPPFALAKARQILESIVLRIFLEHKPGQKPKPLFNMIEELLEGGQVFPRRIATYLHTIRIIGNLVVHGGLKPEPAGASPELSEADVELSLLMTLQLVEWYLLEYAPSRGA